MFTLRNFVGAGLPSPYECKLIFGIYYRTDHLMINILRVAVKLPAVN